MKQHLAQVNIATMLASADSPMMAGFIALLDEINALAESSPGFVWRLKGDEGNATAIRAFENELVIVNLSVWETVEDLKNFAFKSAHTPVMRRRNEWFEKHESAYMALWWIPEGHLPTPEEAKQKLEYLNQFGEDENVFTFRKLMSV